MKIEYRSYKPRGSARGIIDRANSILEEARQDGWSSMTLRQLYYQFVARGFIPNSVPEYKRLGRIVTDARYGGLIDWTAIEDAGRVSYGFPERPTAESVLRGIEQKLTLDPWMEQDFYVEVWVEKQALEGTIARPCSALRAPYMACKGYLSASEAWRAGLRFQAAIDRGQQPVLLHLGDHDPSGIDMTRDNGSRLAEFLDQGVDVRRVALNMDQIEKYEPPPNPAKEDDSRFKTYREQYGDTSWELDALRQNVIGDLITEQLDALIDRDVWDATLAREAELREPLKLLALKWGQVEELVLRRDLPLDRLREYDAAMDMGASKNTVDFLDWLAERLVGVYKESESVDFVLSLRERTRALEAARDEDREDR